MDPMTLSLIVAGIFGVAGSGIKVGSNWIQSNKEKERLEREKAEDLAQLDLEWEMAQKQAFEQADKLKLEADRLKEDSIEADSLTDITENIISQTFNAAIDDISMQEKQNATQLQNEMISTEANIANMEVASGASGVRAGSGTNSDVIAQQKDLAEKNIEREQIMLDQSFQNSLMQVGLGLQQDKINVRGNRFQANRMMENSELTAKASQDLRASYSAAKIERISDIGKGGDAYRAYYMKRNDLMTDYDSAISSANYDWMQGISDALTGFNTGWEFGQNAFKFVSSIVAPKG